MFDPQSEYEISFRDIPIRDFLDFWDEFVVRPPYQRKSVWSRRKQQELLDSLFRRYYVPRIVVREVRLSSENTVREIIDGQQRIITANLFLSDQLPLPNSLEDVHPELPGARYSQLPPELRRFVNRELSYSADVVKGIEDPRNPDHQHIATEIFWRLQQGESLNYMEIAHARLSSLSRNFVVKHAGDIRFDYENYQPVDDNPDKHPFFSIINRNNNRMQHLALLTRFLLLEENYGRADIKDVDIMAYIDRYQVPDGIDNFTFESRPHAREVLSTLTALREVFKNDPMLADGNGTVKELSIEYFIVSTYLLLRHLRKSYVFDASEKELFHEFIVDFHRRWQDRRESDSDILVFSDNRQHSANEIETRHMIVRQIFFDYVKEHGHEMLTKDERRSFDEAERIFIYRRDNGLCQVCLEEGKPEAEARVPWREYDADHIIPHTKGGATDVANAQVLCRYHNRQKGATDSTT